MRVYLTAKTRWLASRPDFHHALVLPSDRDGTEQWHGSTVHWIAGRPAPGSPGYRMLLRPGRLRAILEEERPDVIELGSIYTAPWLLRLAGNGLHARIVGLLHMDLVGAAERAIPPRLPAARRLVRRGLGAYLRAAYARCDRVVATSATGLRALSSAGVDSGDIVPLGVDTARFHPSHRDPAWRRDVAGDEERPIGLFAGRLAAEKDLGVLIQALPSLHRRTGLKLVLIGEGRLRKRLERVARRHPDMLAVLPFEPDLDRLARAYASADVAFAPCSHETFGLAALEAAASGVPVVGAETGAVGELLQDAEWGARFPAGESDGLVTAAESVLQVRSENLRAKARQAAEAYSWDRTFSSLVEIYREVARIL